MPRASRFSNLAAALRPPATPQGRPIRAAYEHNRSPGPTRRSLRQLSPPTRLGVLIVNRPQGLRDMNEKVYTAWFPQCCASTLITRDMGEMAAFLREQRRIVCKPLDGMGGRSIFVLGEGDPNARVVFETLTDHGQRFALVQRYIPDIVESGDARVLLVDGEPVPYALARIPSAQDHRGNLAAGATGVPRPLNDRDRWLSREIGPALAAKGMLFVGLD